MDAKTLVIANPAAGGGRCARKLSVLRAALDSAGVPYELCLTQRQGHAEVLVLDAVKGGKFSSLVIAGGDGTINESVQGLAGTDISLGVIPLGTGNDLVKMLDLPKGIPAQVDVALKGRVRDFDLGRINDRYFINVVGIGFDAAVNQKHYDISWLSGVPSYVLAILITMFNYTPKYMDVEISGTDGTPPDSFARDIHILTIGNGHTCGGGFIFTPGASCRDGELDLSILEPITWLQLLWHLPKIFTGSLQTKAPHLASLRRFCKLRVRSLTPLPVHVDGELYRTDSLEHEIEVVPGAIKVMTPPVGIELTAPLGPTSPTSGD